MNRIELIRQQRNLPLLNELLFAVIDAKPDDPLTFLIQMLERITNDVTSVRGRLLDMRKTKRRLADSISRAKELHRPVAMTLLMSASDNRHVPLLHTLYDQVSALPHGAAVELQPSPQRTSAGGVILAPIAPTNTDQTAANAATSETAAPTDEESSWSATVQHAMSKGTMPSEVYGALANYVRRGSDRRTPGIELLLVSASRTPSFSRKIVSGSDILAPPGSVLPQQAPTTSAPSTSTWIEREEEDVFKCLRLLLDSISESCASHPVLSALETLKLVLPPPPLSRPSSLIEKTTSQVRAASALQQLSHVISCSTVKYPHLHMLFSAAESVYQPTPAHVVAESHDDTAAIPTSALQKLLSATLCGGNYAYVQMLLSAAQRKSPPSLPPVSSASACMSALSSVVSVSGAQDRYPYTTLMLQCYKSSIDEPQGEPKGAVPCQSNSKTNSVATASHSALSLLLSSVTGWRDESAYKCLFALRGEEEQVSAPDDEAKKAFPSLHLLRSCFGEDSGTTLFPHLASLLATQSNPTIC